MDKEKEKYVTFEMFEEYHKQLMDYINIHDNLILHGYAFCLKCGATLTSAKCDKCNTEAKNYEDE